MTAAVLRFWSRFLIKKNNFSHYTSGYSTNIGEKHSHEYLKINPWKNLKQFSEFLENNIIYNKDDLLIINKPYGVGLSSPPTNAGEKSEHTINTSNPAFVGRSQYCLSDVLPHLAESLGYENLTILKVPERYTTGVTVLSPCEKVINKVTTCLKKASGRHQFCVHYWAIVVGCPEPSSAVLKLGLTLKTNPILNYDKQPVVVQKWSKNAVKRQDVKVFRVEHQTLCKQNLASLVEIRPSATKWHFLRIYLAHMLSPILGDNLYGSRVRNVLDVPLAINPFSDAARGPQKLEKQLITALAIQNGQEAIIPTHIHLRRLVLPAFLGCGSDLIIEAPLPSSFQWTCETLGLKYTNEEDNVSSNISCM